jgi:hypothetical protein
MNADTTRGSFRVRSPLATPEELANEPAAFPHVTPAMPVETAFADWRERLSRNLARRSDGRWEPLTYIEGRAEP